MQSDNLIDENSWDKSNENAFYQEKMENITGDGIYNIFKNLSADFCKSEYHTDKTNLFLVQSLKKNEKIISNNGKKNINKRKKTLKNALNLRVFLGQEMIKIKSLHLLFFSKQSI